MNAELNRNHSKQNTEKKRHRRRRHHRHLNKKTVAVSAAVIALAAAGTSVFFLRSWQSNQKFQVTATKSYDMGGDYRTISYNGERYRYNNRITTVLFAGVDSEGKMEASKQYGNKARADSIALAVMDGAKGKMTILSISRDTMTDIRRYSMNGNDDGLYATHLGYAYSYGDGGAVSCKNLCEAVSLLLGGIPVNNYVVTNQDSMPYINSLVGGVTLTVPNDDLAEEYPELTKGAVVHLDENSVRPFLQYRDTSEEFSNEGRMERQKAYVTAYIETLQSLDTGEIESVWNALEQMKEYLQTSITKSQYLSLAGTMDTLEFSEGNYKQLTGEDQAGDLHDEFYPDEDALQQTILDLFYIKE